MRVYLVELGVENGLTQEEAEPSALWRGDGQGWSIPASGAGESSSCSTSSCRMSGRTKQSGPVVPVGAACPEIAERVAPSLR